MQELIVLVTGFAAGTKVWLAAYDFIRAKKLGRPAVFFRGAGRLGVALWAGILAYAVADAPTVSLSWRTWFYLVASVILLVGTVGELVTREWQEPEPR